MRWLPIKLSAPSSSLKLPGPTADAIPLWGARRRSFANHLQPRWRALIRANIRNSDLGLVAVAAIMGIVVGFAVAALPPIVAALHSLLFGVSFDSHLSGGVPIEWWRVLAVP